MSPVEAAVIAEANGPTAKNLDTVRHVSIELSRFGKARRLY